jgi:hypothetical protein
MHMWAIVANLQWFLQLKEMMANNCCTLLIYRMKRMQTWISHWYTKM